jgi:hypothetical protein
MRMLAGALFLWLLHGHNAAPETASCCCCCRRQVVLSGLSGTYSSYITTWEEYQVQRYEGASTLYGPHTLDAYIQTVLELVQVTLHAMYVFGYNECMMMYTHVDQHASQAPSRHGRHHQYLLHQPHWRCWFNWQPQHCVLSDASA